MKYVNINACTGCELTATYYNNDATIYLVFGDQYTRVSAEDSYGSPYLELGGDEPTIERDGHDLVRIGLISEAHRAAHEEARRLQFASEREANERQIYERLKAKFGE